MANENIFKQMCNYSVVMSLLGYSQSKFEKLAPFLDQLIYTNGFVSNEALKMYLGVTDSQIKQSLSEFQASVQDVDLRDFSVLSIRDQDYPELLSKIHRAPQMLFMKGNIDLLKTNCVSVVGSRQVSEEGIRRTQRVSLALAANGFTVISGLAKGVDTAAHICTMKAGGNTIAVIGTPITKAYPSENRPLQSKISEGHLVVSQFPLQQPVSPFNFPQRNFTMCGLSMATVIVEAGETSGALYQAKACMQESRTLFVMKNLLEKKELTWPKKFVDKGAIVLDDIDTLLRHLENAKVKTKKAAGESSEQLTFLDVASS